MTGQNGQIPKKSFELNRLGAVFFGPGAVFYGTINRVKTGGKLHQVGSCVATPQLQANPNGEGDPDTLLSNQVRETHMCLLPRPRAPAARLAGIVVQRATVIDRTHCAEAGDAALLWTFPLPSQAVSRPRF